MSDSKDIVNQTKIKNGAWASIFIKATKVQCDKLQDYIEEAQKLKNDNQEYPSWVKSSLKNIPCIIQGYLLSFLKELSDPNVDKEFVKIIQSIESRKIIDTAIYLVEKAGFFF